MSTTMIVYPKSPQCRVRRYHLWNANERKPMRWRYYQIKENAHNGALIEARWAKIGVVIEVVDALRGVCLGQYVRGVNDIKFYDFKADAKSEKVAA